MADYAIITNHTDYGMQLMQSDPAMASNLASQADTEVRNRTSGNYGISNVYIDFDNKLTYYDLIPLTASAKAEMQQASLGMASIGWFDVIKIIITVIVAAAAFVVGALVGGWAMLAGAIIAGAILLFSYLTSQIEYKQDIIDIDKEYARQYAAGEITGAQYDEFVAAKHKAIEAVEINWKTIVIYALIGFGGLYALSMILKKR